MSRFSNQDCKFFGSRTQEKQDSTNRCRRCLVETPDMFAECTAETNELLIVSVLVDEDGNTLLTNDKISTRMKRNPPTETTVQHVGRRVKRVKEPKMTEETPVNPVTPKISSTVGVLTIARSMLVDGKPTEQIMSALIAEYQKAGKSPKQAKHNAQSCLFNARKKLSGGSGTTKKPVEAPVVPSDQAVNETTEIPGKGVEVISADGVETTPVNEAGDETEVIE